MSDPTDKTPDITPEIRKMLTDVVKRQCVELITYEFAGGVRNGKNVANFMSTTLNGYLSFNGFERALILKFMVETEEIVTKALTEMKGGK